MSALNQTALLVTEIGKPLIKATDRPIPQPGPSQIQVQVTVAGLNPHDQKCRDRGLLVADVLPVVLGNDVVGRVTALGLEAKRFRIGDRVVGQGAGLQEFDVLDEAFVAKIPDAVTDYEAATLPINAVTSLIALFDGKALAIPAPWTPASSVFDYAAVTILIIGGGANCGKFGVQLASLAGIGRIVVVGGGEAELKKYGATHVLDRHGPLEEVLKSIRAVVGDDLVYVFDAINPPAAQSLAINALSCTKRGKLARLVSSGQIEQTQVHSKKAGYDLANVYGASHASPELSKVFWKNLPQYLLDGQLKASKFQIIKGLDADLVNEALDGYRDGKKVIKPQVHVS